MRKREIGQDKSIPGKSQWSFSSECRTGQCSDWWVQYKNLLLYLVPRDTSQGIKLGMHRYFKKHDR